MARASFSGSGRKRVAAAVFTGAVGVGLTTVGVFWMSGTQVRADVPATMPTAGNVLAESKALFDPTRHMRVAEVRPGMKGYGLSVFKGTKIERFEVEVVSVVHNFSPGFNGVLIMCRGQNMEHSGSVAGMSGSPIYLYDEAGKARMIGAFAFGWDMAKDPIAGVQPIEYMLEYADPKVARAGSREIGESRQETGEKTAGGGGAMGRARFEYGAAREAALALFEGRGLGRAEEGGRASGVVGVTLSASGVSAATWKSLSPVLTNFGLNVGGSGGGGMPLEMQDAEAKIEPGSSLVVPLLRGDLDLSALGTCTEVIGDRVWGFGHPFNNEGGVELPMAAGYVNTIISTLSSSFKMGSSTKILGVLRSDTGVGVGGTFGGTAAEIPVSVRLMYEDGTLDRTYRYTTVRHPKFTPLMVLSALIASMQAVRDLPGEHTLTYSVDVKFAETGLNTGGQGGTTLKLGDIGSNVGLPEMIVNVAVPILLLTNNPFGRAYPESVEATLRVGTGGKSAEILGVSAPKPTYRAGEPVVLSVLTQPYHRTESRESITLNLPADLPAGEYEIAVSDKGRFDADDMQLRPDKYAADDLAGVFNLFRELSARRSDALYARLVRTETGLAVGKVALPRLPGSKAALLMSAGNPRVRPVSESLVTVKQTGIVMSGKATVTIVVEDENGRPPVIPPGVGHNKNRVGGPGGKLELKVPGSGGNPTPPPGGE